MSYVMSPIESYLMDDSSYDTFGNLQVGSNGDAEGDPTSDVGDVFGEENYAYTAWDSDLDGGFDTSNVPIALDVTSDGSESLSVASNAPLTYQTGSIGPISSVVLEAAVQTNATSSWSNVTVTFLKNGSVREVDSIGNGPQVNTVSSGSANVADQTLTVTPSAPDDDEAIVSGVMRMTSPGINYPASQAMFCNIFVKGANASSGGSGGGISIGGGGGDNPEG
jgi:hypothetical protein